MPSYGSDKICVSMIILHLQRLVVIIIKLSQYKVIYGTSISFLHELFGRQIQVGAEEIFSKTPEFYQCNLIAGVMQEECDQLFVETKRLRDLQLIGVS